MDTLAPVIRSFRHKGLRLFFETGSLRGIQAQHVDRLQRQLGLLDSIKRPELMNVPGFGFHALHGELKGHWAVKVSGNWRLTFTLKVRMRCC